MLITADNPAVHTLVEWNVEAEPNLHAIYLFPAEDEIRLLAIDPATLPDTEIRPFTFGAYPQGGVPYPTSIAAVLPRDRERLSPPRGWGSWEDGQRVWSRN